ncbi:MAG: hypothetical protein C0396_01040 [Anaerolinea sp.]|nr:hypothetical protein [Anaerolinea sp.]
MVPTPRWNHPILSGGSTLRSPGGVIPVPSADGWNGQERITLQQALESYTIHPAFAAGREGHLGALAPGYHADLIVLPTDPFKMEPAELHTVKPDRVMVGGQWVSGV